MAGILSVVRSCYKARARGTAVVFHLHNFGYNDRRGFDDVVPSFFRRSIRGDTIGAGSGSTALSFRPDPARQGDRREPRPKFVTFINPQPDKGAAVFARIALELGRRRPDIPLLVVEGRGTADGLAGLPVDLSGLTNLHRMANTPDPRDFYRVSRAVLMPSLWRESLGRVPIEAMANGIPVLASDRGACPRHWAMPGSCSRFRIGARPPAAWCRPRRRSHLGWP